MTLKFKLLGTALLFTATQGFHLLPMPSQPGKKYFHVSSDSKLRRHHAGTTTTTTTTTQLGMAQQERTWPPRRGDPLLTDYLTEDYFSDPNFYTERWPFSVDDMKRRDEKDDAEFYTEPRFSRHVDEWALIALREYYGTQIEEMLKQKQQEKDTDDSSSVYVLDLCSSWMSHLPESYERGNSKSDNVRVVGVGMNEEELEANPHLDSWHIQDLNETPNLQELFPNDESFDMILMTCSVDYLIQPKEVFAELQRLLRPGGTALITFSNRCFPTKVVRTWLHSNDSGRQHIVASYFYCSQSVVGSWESIQAYDIGVDKTFARTLQLVSKPDSVGRWLAGAVMRDTFKNDPLYAIKAVKKKQQ